MNCCTAPKCFIVPTQRSEKRTALSQRPQQDPSPSLLEEHVSKMRTLSSKTLLAALNPSPVFEAVAIFAERLALNGDESRPNEICVADNFGVQKRRGQMSVRFKGETALQTASSMCPIVAERRRKLVAPSPMRSEVCHLGAVGIDIPRLSVTRAAKF